jgi:thiosulfate reductase cytochrome b subunit
MNSKASLCRSSGWVLSALVVVAGLLLLLNSSSPGFAEDKAQAASAKSEEKKAGSDELSNEGCIGCHNPDILKMSKEELAENVEVGDKPQPAKPKPPFVFGKLNLSIDAKKYEAGVHAETQCVDCHKDVAAIPHAQRLKGVDCAECHDEAVATIEASAHGKKAKPKGKTPECFGCHDVHYGQGQKQYAADWNRKLCLECHKAYGMDTVKAHVKLYEAGLHLQSLGCMDCHAGKKPGVHHMPARKGEAAACEACHSKCTKLSKEKIAAAGFVDYVMMTQFINMDVLKKYGYVVGAHRIPALDLVVVLLVLGPLALPIFHGGIRIITRRKEPLHIPDEKILLHPLFERLWHWFQALCIVMLIITGAMIHWPEKFPGWFQWAVSVHNWFGVAAVAAFICWFIYNIVTGRIRHYIPSKEEIPRGLITQAKFYGYGIFKHEPHPYAPSEENKFNPLQKIAYFQFQVLFLPLLLLSGLMYLYPETFAGAIKAIGGMTVLAVIHYALGALFAAFLVAHIYLATTGETIGENFKAIIFGYGTKFDHEGGGH